MIHQYMGVAPSTFPLSIFSFFIAPIAYVSTTTSSQSSLWQPHMRSASHILVLATPCLFAGFPTSVEVTQRLQCLRHFLVANLIGSTVKIEQNREMSVVHSLKLTAKGNENRHVSSFFPQRKWSWNDRIPTIHSQVRTVTSVIFKEGFLGSHHFLRGWQFYGKMQQLESMEHILEDSWFMRIPPILIQLFIQFVWLMLP